MASVDWKKTNVPTLARMGTHFDNERRKQTNHSNEDIDKERTCNNYYFGCNGWRDILKKARKFIKRIDRENPPKKKQNPDNRITMVSLNIPCPREITEAGMSQLFFEYAQGVLQDQFGEAYSGMAVHVDEVHDYMDNGKLRTSCEHGHAFVCAYVEWEQKCKKGIEKRKGINGKNFETKESILKLNKAFDDMCQVYFGISYNNGNEVVLEYK